MKFKNFLNEEWFNSYKMFSDTIEVFKNPKSTHEVVNKNKYLIRAMLSKEGDVYCWDGDSPAMHYDMADKLDMNLSYKEDIPLYFKRGRVAISVSVIPYNSKGEERENIKDMLIYKVSRNLNIKKIANVDDIEFGEFN